MRRMGNTTVFIIILICFVLGINCGTTAREPFFNQIDLFVSGTDNYDNYRIPAVIVTPRGTVLAFCEGRSKDSDTGDINMLLKRSFDNGNTWQPMQIVWDDDSNTCGNPCPVVDRETGVIWLLLTHNPGKDHQKQIQLGTSTGTRTIWVTKSTDEGATWSEPVDITETTKKPDGAFCGTGPGIGIQLTTGRLVIPCYDNEVGVVGEKWYSGPWPSYIIYSDDHGETWEMGSSTVDYGAECQVVELINGTLLLNIRDQNINKRGIATSGDSGLAWSNVTFDDTLIDPHCQASIIRFTDEKHHDKNRILFSNPASITKREKMTVRLSYDECNSWPVSKLINPGLSAYSCLTVLNDGSIACLYECGTDVYNEKIALAIFNLEWLTDGADGLPQ